MADENRTKPSANGRYDLALDEHGREFVIEDSALVMTGDHSVGWVHLSLTDEN